MHWPRLCPIFHSIAFHLWMIWLHSGTWYPYEWHAAISSIHIGYSRISPRHPFSNQFHYDSSILIDILPHAIVTFQFGPRLSLSVVHLCLSPIFIFYFPNHSFTTSFPDLNPTIWYKKSLLAGRADGFSNPFLLMIHLCLPPPQAEYLSVPGALDLSTKGRLGDMIHEKVFGLVECI